MQLWLASLCFYAYSYGICLFLRGLLSLRRNGKLKTFLGEVVATVQVCLPIFDVDLIFAEYGLLGVFVQICFLEYLNSKTLDKACFTCPCYFVSPKVTEECIEKMWKFPLVFLAQCLAAGVCYPMALLFWSYNIHSHHYQKFYEDQVESDLAVSVTTGFLFEFLGTLIGRLFELQTSSDPRTRKFSSGSCSFLYSLITVIGVTSTGMYCNPISATACLWNSANMNIPGHVTVYWAAPVIGWFIAEWIHALLETYGVQLQNISTTSSFIYKMQSTCRSTMNYG